MQGLAFYETLAQIIPLLFVVMVFEARWFRIMDFLPEARRQERLFFCFVAVYVAMGEGIALYVLYFEREFFLAPFFVLTALAVEVFGMVGVAQRSEMANKIDTLRGET